MCGTQPTATSTSGTFDTTFDAITTIAMNARSPDASPRAITGATARTARVEHAGMRDPGDHDEQPGEEHEQLPVDRRERLLRRARARRASAPPPRTSPRPASDDARDASDREQHERAERLDREHAIDRGPRRRALGERPRRQRRRGTASRAAIAFAARHATPDRQGQQRSSARTRSCRARRRRRSCSAGCR